jgi:transposase
VTCAFLGLSQFGLLHFGHTRGFSSFSRDNHSCPQRQRQPRNITIPISVSLTILPSCTTTGIYDLSCLVKLQVVYTDCSKDGERRCKTGGKWIGNIAVCKSPPWRKLIARVGFGSSQSGKGRYTVCPDPTEPHCTCQDHATTGGKCKHMFAVEFVVRREENADGSISITESVVLSRTVTRPTYRQNWAAYNAAQTNEKHEFQKLLYDLCQNLAEPPRKRGRPRMPISDAVFAIAFKVYSTFSGRRFISDLTEAYERGYLKTLPHFNSIFNYLENPALTPILKQLITDSSLPLKAIEKDFAVDSSGFTTTRFTRWFDHKYRGNKEHNWVKAHVMCGVKTHIVTTIDIQHRDASDTLQLPSLLAITAGHFNVSEVSADKAYASVSNFNAIDQFGATPYIPFKSSHTGSRGGLFQKAFHYYHLHRDEFLEHYHKRSNIETTFDMIKAKFRDHVRSKTEIAMANEVYCKVLCHNICCLIQRIYELGITPEFIAEHKRA